MNNKNTLISFEGLHLSVTIDTAHYLPEHVEYPVRISYSANESITGDSYIIVKRYSDFDNLRRSIRQHNLPVQLPPKKLFGNFDMTIVNERQILLEKFLKSILNIPIISKSLPVTAFFQKDGESVTDYAKIALQQVSLDFRCETNWQVGKVLNEMGCRIKKNYLSISNISNQKKYVLGWAEFGPEYSPLNFTACHKLMKLLPTLKHEFIFPVEYTVDNESSVSVIRPVSELGSLHDFMLKVKPVNSITVKYAYQSSNPTLVNDVSLFGRQILIALKYLHDKGWPYGHLHIRNVLMINDQRCGLTDIENSLIGLVPQERNYFVGMLKKLTFEEIDIYCFGRLIFQMVFGYPLESTFIDNIDQLRFPSPSIRDFLFSVLTESVLKSGFPKIEILLENSLFKSFTNKPIDKGPFKLTDSCKEFLLATHQYSIKLLVADQKLVKSERRKKVAGVIEMKKKQQRKDESRRIKNPSTVDEVGDIFSQNLPQKECSPSVVRTVSKDGERPPKSPNPPPNAPPAPPPPPPMAAAAPPTSLPSCDPGRGQLLNNISGFNKNNLRKIKTNDKSVPRL